MSSKTRHLKNWLSYGTVKPVATPPPFYVLPTVRGWCAREDLNLHPLRDQILSLERLPFRHARNKSKQFA